MKTYAVTPQSNRLSEMVLLMGHNLCFKEVIWKIIPKLSLLPFLSGALLGLRLVCGRPTLALCSVLIPRILSSSVCVEDS